MSNSEQANYDRVQKDINVLKGDISSLAAQLSGALADVTDSARRNARRGMKRARANVDSVLSDAGEQGSAALAAAQDAATTIEETLEDAITQRPLAAVGVAIGLGFLIGVTWRR